MTPEELKDKQSKLCILYLQLKSLQTQIQQVEIEVVNEMNKVQK